MQQIIIEASDVWDYFREHREELENAEHIIAKNEEYGVEICLTSEECHPCLVVTADEYQYACEIAISANDCKSIVEELYEEYLTESFIETTAEEGLLDQEDMISERELELDDAVALLLDTILEEDAFSLLGKDADEICEDLKDHILEYLYRKHEISTRRPMVLEDTESGEDFFEEYPYECMEFEDKDNPLYK